MRAKELARAYLILGKIHAAILDGIMDYNELFEHPEFKALLILIYKNEAAIPASYFVVVYDLRLALLRKTLLSAEIVTHLQHVLNAIHRKRRLLSERRNGGIRIFHSPSSKPQGSSLTGYVR